MKIFFLPVTSNIADRLVFDQQLAWEIVDNPTEADMWVIGEGITNKDLTEFGFHGQYLLFPLLFHMDHHHTTDYFDEFKKNCSVADKIIIVHTNTAVCNDPRYLHFDYTTYKHKLYCTDYDKIIMPDHRVWTIGCVKENYELHPIIKVPNKKFLVVMRFDSLSDRGRRRRSIYDLLFDICPDDTIASLNNRILPYMSSDLVTTFMSVVANEPMLPDTLKPGGIWYPPSYQYYDSTIVSIYTETLVCKASGAKMLTEKTLNPMIQGNFVLPFGYPGLLRDIEDYGFKLPTWIDYSYDIIDDDDERFAAYLDSIRILSQMPHEEMFELYVKDKHILEYNRQVILNKPYDDLHAMVTAYIERQ